MAYRRVGLFLVVGSWLLVAGATAAQNPPPTEPTPATQTSTQAPATSNQTQQPATPPATSSGANKPSDANVAEVTTHDTAPTFKVRVNEVLVRVVVRDESGKIIPGLKKEDFQLFDNRKLQTITSFRVETPETNAVKAQAVTTENPEGGAPTVTPVPTLPQRFVAVVFDDISLIDTDAVAVRTAAGKLFDSLALSDRIGIYTTSGQATEEFTSDRRKLSDALLKIVPRPIQGGGGIPACPDISYYQADQIENFHNDVALGVAVEEYIACTNTNVPENGQAEAQAVNMVTNTVHGLARGVLSLGDQQTQYVYRHLEDILRRLSGMPGQHVMVFVSPGFMLTADTRRQGDLIDRANRAGVVINTIDARGLYAPDLMGDISGPSTGTYRGEGPKMTFRLQTQFAQTEILGELADGTGGTFFHNRNDLDVGMQRAAAAPAYAYLLAFSPQNLKIDGNYHALKVSLVSKAKVTIQARHGYYAPRTIKDPAEAAKEEIEEAIFSQEEIRDVPIELQTQFFKSSDTQAKLAVLTHVDVNAIRFRKDAGRSKDNLTFATAIFDENGNFITGGEKILEMKLLDPTLARLDHTGLTVKSSFDIKPGTYLVRMVVRDGEGAQMAAKNGAVTIPY
ncbi:MAG: VWA domain-containing protein [Acidobacteria bacterium]|nr:VWA domain-containing protein [Acidobacteriota bacterium]